VNTHPKGPRGGGGGQKKDGLWGSMIRRKGGSQATRLRWEEFRRGGLNRNGVLGAGHNKRQLAKKKGRQRQMGVVEEFQSFRSFRKKGGGKGNQGINNERFI